MAMTDSAEENLRVIRSLMERATVYRTISVPGAVLGGILSFVACGIHWWTPCFSGRWGFLTLWGIVLLLTAMGNGGLIWGEAKKSHGKFFSPAFKTALRGLFPPFLVAAVITLLFSQDEALLPFLWMGCYGLGLLGTQHFAPRSLVILGWTFVVAAFALAIVGTPFLYMKASMDEASQAASLMMALTFGLFHLVYALCVHLSLRRERAS